MQGAVGAVGAEKKSLTKRVIFRLGPVQSPSKYIADLNTTVHKISMATMGIHDSQRTPTHTNSIINFGS